jgi:hypothetical protein
LDFRSSDRNPRINASGQVAFYSLVCCTGVNSTNDKVLWLSTSSGIEVVAREGSPAPGTTVNFGTFQPAVFSDVALNSAGQVAFVSTLTGSGVTTLNDLGLWAGAPGNLSLVVREGDVIDVDPGPGEILKTVSTFSFADGYDLTENTSWDSASAAFNDAGQISWWAQFTDASRAIFLTTLPSQETPTPGDFNEDGVVDAGDYATWRNHFGEANEDGIHGNGDGMGGVDEDDYTLWRQYYGTTYPGSGGGALGSTQTAVPEPSTLLLALLAGGAVGLVGRQKLLALAG